ncbi:MAG: hypothetical protein H7257_13335 [Taibaiella sp.]|nr:hypothetical protein [Taibaiella sp.]
MNKVIGLVGEDPNDTTAVKNLLLQRFNKNITYLPLINRARGYQLDNARVKHALCIECRIKKPDIVLFIRDADGVATETNAISKCKDWFHRMSADLKSQNILLLNIYELEALIFADI